MHYLFLFLLAIALPLTAAKTKQEQMLCEIETLANFFEVCYGPSEYKTNLYEWDPAAELENARSQILAKGDMTTKEFHQVLRQYCQSTKDYHVSIQFCSTENSTLPLWVRQADNRYFIIDEDSRLAVAEIILFDGFPVHNVVEALRTRFINCTNMMTDQAMATRYLTNRPSMAGLPTPKGKVKLTILVNGEYATQEMEWDHTPELIAHSVVPQKKKKHQWSKYEYITPYYYLLDDTKLFAAPDSFVPAIGKPLWQAPGGLENPFSAAIYQIDSGERIGYIRIPHFVGSDNDAELFRQTIGHLEKKTQALVIDQTGNPGGYAIYMMALVSMLTDRPILNVKDSLLLNQNEIEYALYELAELEGEDALLLLKSNSLGYPFIKADIEHRQSHLRQIVKDWNKNKAFSDPSPLMGIPTIRPHPKTRYTKPIIVLVNETCFSCGDIFPALLQDSKRATIFGQTTAGAGGCVESVEYPNHSGVSEITITRSLVYRADGKHVENVGVTPDIVYTITPQDLHDGFQGYKEALIKAIQQELNKSKPR